MDPRLDVPFGNNVDDAFAGFSRFFADCVEVFGQLLMPVFDGSSVGVNCNNESMPVGYVSFSVGDDFLRILLADELLGRPPSGGRGFDADFSFWKSVCQKKSSQEHLLLPVFANDLDFDPALTHSPTRAQQLPTPSNLWSDRLQRGECVPGRFRLARRERHLQRPDNR